MKYDNHFIGEKVNTIIGSGIIVGFGWGNGNYYTVKLDKWNEQDIERMGGEENAWIMLDSDTQFIQ